MGQFMGLWADAARLTPRTDVRTIRFMIASFRLLIDGEFLKGKGLEQPRSLPGLRIFETLVPIRDRAGKPVTQFRQLRNLSVERSDLVRCHARDPSAWRSASVPLSEYPGEFGEAKSSFDRTADGLNAEQSAGGIETVSSFRAHWLGEKR
jgi:hypothetical protein